MRLFLTSVPHSGTTFFVKLLRPDYVCHLYNREKVERVSMGAAVAACAIRRPEAVWASWCRRGQGHLKERWQIAWQSLEWFGQSRRVYWLPIDHPQRDERLAALEEATGMKVNPDWSVKENESVADGATPPPIDLSAIYTIPVVKELYQ